MLSNEVKRRGYITQQSAPTTVDIHCGSSTALVLLSLTFQAITVALFTMMLMCTHSCRPMVCSMQLYLTGSTYMQVSNFGHFLASRTTYMRINLYASIYGNCMREGQEDENIN